MGKFTQKRFDRKWVKKYGNFPKKGLTCFCSILFLPCASSLMLRRTLTDIEEK